MGKLSKIKISGRKIELSDLRGLNSRDISEDAAIILEQPEIPDEVLSVLSFHEDASVRLALAQRESNSEEILRRLATDDDSKIGKTAKKQLRKQRTFKEKIHHLLDFLFSSLKKIILFTLAVAAIAYTISLLRPSITPEKKAYEACVKNLKISNPQVKDLSSCSSYLKKQGH